MRHRWRYRVLSILLSGTMAFTAVPVSLTAYGADLILEDEFADDAEAFFESDSEAFYEETDIERSAGALYEVPDGESAEASDEEAYEASEAVIIEEVEEGQEDVFSASDTTSEEIEEKLAAENGIRFASEEIREGDTSVQIAVEQGISGGFVRIILLGAEEDYDPASFFRYAESSYVTVGYGQLGQAGAVSVDLSSLSLRAGDKLIAVLKDSTSGSLVEYDSETITILPKKEESVDKTPQQAYLDSRVTISTLSGKDTFQVGDTGAHISYHLDPKFENAALFVFENPGGASFDPDNTANKRLFVQYVSGDGELDVTFQESSRPLTKGWNITATLYICVDGDDWYLHRESESIEIVDENGEGTPVYHFPHIDILEDELEEGATALHATLTGDERLFSNENIDITYIVVQYPKDKKFDLDEPYMDPLAHVQNVKGGFENLEIPLKSPVRAGYRVRAIVYWSQDIDSFVPKGNDYEAAGIPDNSVPVRAAVKPAQLSFDAASVEEGASSVSLTAGGEIPEGSLVIVQAYPKDEVYQFGGNGIALGNAANVTAGKVEVEFRFNTEKVTSENRLAAVILFAGEVIAVADSIPIHKTGSMEPVDEPTIQLQNTMFTTVSKSADLAIAGADEYIGGRLFIKTGPSEDAIRSEGANVTILYSGAFTSQGVQTISFTNTSASLKAGYVIGAYLYRYDGDLDRTYYLYSDFVRIESTGEEAFEPTVEIVTSELVEGSASLWIKANFDANAVKGTLLLYNYAGEELDTSDFSSFTILKAGDITPGEGSQKITFIDGRTPLAASRIKALLRTENLVTGQQKETWSDVLTVKSEDPLSQPVIGIKDRKFTTGDVYANLYYNFDNRADFAKYTLLYYPEDGSMQAGEVLSASGNLTKSSAQDSARFNHNMTPLTAGYRIAAKLEVVYKGETTTVYSDPVIVEKAPDWAEPTITILAQELNLEDREITVKVDYNEGYLELPGFFSNISIYQYPDSIDDTKDEFWETYATQVETVASVQNQRGEVTLKLFDTKALKPGYKIMAKLRLPHPEWWDEFNQDADEDYVSEPVYVYGNRGSLLYHLGEDDETGKKLREIFQNRKVAVTEVSEADLAEKIGTLVGLEGYERSGETYEGEAPATQFLLMVNFSDAFLDLILDDMKQAGIFIAHKAILTDTNREYTLAQLIGDIEEEHETMTALDELRKQVAEAEKLLGDETLSEKAKKDLEDAIALAKELLGSGSEDMEAIRRLTENVRNAAKEAEHEMEAAAKAKEEAEKAEAEKAAREKAEAEKAAREKAEAEKAAREKAEAEKAAKEKAEAEKAAKEQEEKAAQGPKKGTVLKKGTLKYKVTKAGRKATSSKKAVSGTVTVTGFSTSKTAGKAKKLTIPATVRIGGITYQVTGIGAGAFKNSKKLTSVTLGTNLKTIGKNAFLNSRKLKTVTVKSKALTKIGKNAFKGITKKATLKVKVKGSASAKKKITAKYKTLFKKAGIK